MKKIYISGKITDNPNYKAEFEAAELALKIAGFQPVNPAEEHHGWRESAGAKIEHKLARDLGIEIIYEIKKPVYNAEYRRAQYIKHREGTLKKQKEYDDQHREEINRKARARYRAKCGLKPIKEAE